MVTYEKGQEKLSKYFRLPDGATVFQAEIMAITKAANLVQEQCRQEPGRIKYVKFYIDSQAAISAVGNPYVKSQAVAQAIENLNELASSVTSLTLVWIPAHKGHAGNERADELAKLGSASEDPGDSAWVGAPKATVKTSIAEEINKAWQLEWHTNGIAQHTKGFYSGPHSGKAKFVYKLARLELGRFVRIVTGHNNLNFFQTKIGLWNNPLCRLCGEGNETISHFFLCPRLRAGRQDIFLDKLPTADMSWSVRDLLHFSYIPEVNAAYEGDQSRCLQSLTDEDILDEVYDLDWLENGGGAARPVQTGEDVTPISGGWDPG